MTNYHRTRLDFWICIALSLFLGVLMYGCEEARASEIPVETIILEAQGESLEGQIAVGEVIRNRANKASGTFDEVCQAKYQFSCWNDRKWAMNGLKRASGQAYQTASRAWADSEWTDLTKGATHYHAKSVRPYWAKGNKPSAVIGNHLFYNTIK